MIYETEFKGVKGIELSNEANRVIVLPSVGGKMASFYNKRKDFELLFQNKEEVYREAKTGDDFSSFDCSGFDDCFPTIDTCTIKGVEYPDHGEIWSGNFTYKIEKEILYLYYKSNLLPYEYRKKIQLKENGLEIGYRISNIGNEPIPCLWAMHCLINCEENMKLNFPTGTNKVENVAKSDYLGNVGDIHPYPSTIDSFGKEYKLDRVFSAKANKCEKYYVSGKVDEGKCSVYYPNKEIRFTIEYNQEKLPYLGFWITEGGFKGDYNCAFEPANGYYDSVTTALQKGKSYQLEPEKPLEFSIELTLD